MRIVDTVVGRFRDMSPRARTWWRYTVTSAVSTAVSEATVVALYATHALGAALASVAASLVGTVPAYVMSRYWIWPDADRGHMSLQVASFLVVAVVSLVLASVGTGLAAAHAPSGHSAHVAVVGVAYIGVYGILWVAKFVVYEKALFRPHPHG